MLAHFCRGTMAQLSLKQDEVFAVKSSDELSKSIWDGLSLGPESVDFGMIEVLELKMPKTKVQCFDEFKDMLEQYFSDESDGLEGEPKDLIKAMIDRRDA